MRNINATGGKKPSRFSIIKASPTGIRYNASTLCLDSNAMHATDYDLVICGAGPVGCALALQLAQLAPDPSRIALIGRPLPENTTVSPGDPRALALNHGSAKLLQNLNAWPASGLATMETVHVSQQGRLGRTLINASELTVPFLGAVIRYDLVLRTLQTAVQQSAIQFLHADIQTDHSLQQPNVVVTDQGKLSTRIRVLSDGLRPQGLHRHYRQHGVISTLRSQFPKKGWAYERFTKNGPFALLPHPDGEDLYALVWCNPPDIAAELATMPEQEFNQNVMQAFGSRLGTLSVVEKRSVFPLNLYAGPTLPDHHTVAIGNAAQTLHPVAGQGLNLGLRDAAQLAQALRPWLACTTNDAAPVLTHYATTRRQDRWLTLGVTDMLPRVFSTTNPLVQHACGLGLLGMDLFAATKNSLATHLLQGTRI